MSDESVERVSDLTRIDGGGAKRRWPPEQPAPGVEFRRMPTGQNSDARQKQHLASVLVPVVTDAAAMYRNCRTSRLRPREIGECGTCKGARFLTGVVRRGEAYVPTGRVHGCPTCGGSGRDGTQGAGQGAFA